MELEFHQLDRKYAGLRIADVGRTARLVPSLCAHGQQQPVLVVRGVDDDGGVARYVLIDGYARVAALDPHGDLVEHLVVRVPTHRRDDLIYVDVPDPSQPWGFNPLARVPADKRPLAASALLEAFKKLWSD